MNKNKTALLVIDMQLVAFDGKITPAIADGDTLLNQISSLIEHCRSNDVQVVYLQTCAFSGRPYAKDMHGWEIHPRLAPQENERVFHKVGPSAFENQDLQTFLQNQGIHNLLVCGIWSEGCVAFSCRSALELGYDVALVADAHGTVRDNREVAAGVVSEQNSTLAGEGCSLVHLADLL